MKRENFYPLTYLRDIEALRCGARTLAEHPERKIEHLWDLIKNLKEDLGADLKVMGSGIKGKLHSSVVVLEKKNVLIEKGVEIEPNVVLDARSGPIYIAEGTIVKAGANLRGPLSIGPHCRISGEVSASIFHGYANKAHYGFIGHSYIGEWVNLGAGTTNSNLKNNYGTVKVWVNDEMIDSGEQFVGCFIGDHAKTGIGTLITTGAVIGVGANVFGGGVTAKYVPNFAWGANEKYKLEAFLEAAGKMMGRRGRQLDDKQRRIIESIYQA